MATFYGLKPRFQALLRPLVRRLAAAGVTANQVTVAAAVISIVYGGLIFVTGGATIVLLCLPLILLDRMALNAIDGMLAREHRQESRLGFLLNEIGDVISDTALYLPLSIVIAPQAPLLIGLMMVAIVLTEFVGVLGLEAGGGRRYDGPFGKSDRAIFFSIVAVAMAAFNVSPIEGAVVLGVALVLAATTVITRIYAALGGPRG